MPERGFKLPDLGEGLTDGEVVRWLVAEGDTVVLNQPLVEVETAKAAVEIPSPYAGTVTKLHAGEGDTVDVGALLVTVDTATAGAPSAPPAVAGADVVDAAAAGAAGTAGEASAAATVAAAATAGRAAADRQAIDGAPEADLADAPMLVGPGPRQEVRRRRQGPQLHAASGPEAPAMVERRPMATPPVRKYAKDRGIDLSVVRGTGKDGRITRDDVDSALAADGQPAPLAGLDGQAAAERPAVARGQDQRIAVRGTRKAIAAQMAASAFSIPHVTEFLTVDATELMSLRDRIRSLPEASGVKVTPLAIIGKALCVAIRRFPMMNSSWDDAATEIVVKPYVHLGFATDTENGLVVPNVKDADTLGILDLAREIERLTGLARTRRASPGDLTGGTVTITNVGGFGVETGTPIINKPECAILATGSIAPRPWVVDGQLAVRRLMTVSVSFDHRIVDGAYAARFLSHLRDLLEDPPLLAAF